ncbi:MAG: hypothetical protein R3E86_10970 [Pseudomonadales bacterium]
MHFVYGLIALTFIVVALLHVPHPTPFLWVPYALAASLAALTLLRDISTLMSRFLAIAATALMFFFFAGFFFAVPELKANWYVRPEGWIAVSKLLGAFAMIPVLSDYSCRCKADCRESREHSSAFFSIPAKAEAPGSSSGRP